ncbi:hypothetical protein Syun_021399 [Stephania yunnanensis]|uniref:Kinesin motor domain-containing protein n=1 Tax=Stephania yunnanensis TaxID=152371 RepID=A0AAP0IHI7_9MAGN
MTAIEEMAGMDVLCSDKTSTLTVNKLTVDKNMIKVFAEGVDKDMVVLMAAKASRLENHDAIDSVIVSILADPREARAGIEEVHFLSFNPTNKKTALTYLDQQGKMHRVSKGTPELVGILLMNMESSRSHCAYIFTVQQESVRDNRLKTGKLILLDLDGSEKIEKTGAEGKILEAAQTINKSFSAPGNSFSSFDWDSARCSCEGTAKWLLDELARRETDAERSLMHRFKMNMVTSIRLWWWFVKPYIKWPASMATSLDTGVPWVMCQQSDALDPVVTSDSPAGKSTYSLIREPEELVKIKYTDVPLLYYTEILSMPDGLATEFKNSVAIPSLIFQEYMHESDTESETEIRIPSLIPLLIRNGIRDEIRNGIFPSLIPLLISNGIRNEIFISVSDSVSDAVSD